MRCLLPKCLQNAPGAAPDLPKATPRPSQNHPLAHLGRSWRSSLFLMIFLFDFCSNLAPFGEPKWHQNATQNGPKTKTKNKMQKIPLREQLETLRKPKIIEKPNENQWILKNQKITFWSDFGSKMLPFGRPFRSQNGKKTNLKKHQKKMRKMIENEQPLRWNLDKRTESAVWILLVSAFYSLCTALVIFSFSFRPLASLCMALVILFRSRSLRASSRSLVALSFSCFALVLSLRSRSLVPLSFSRFALVLSFRSRSVNFRWFYRCFV